MYETEKKDPDPFAIVVSIVFRIAIFVGVFLLGKYFGEGTPASFASDSEYRVVAFVESLSAGEKTVIAVKKGKDEKKYYRFGRKCNATLPAKFTLPLRLVTNSKDSS